MVSALCTLQLFGQYPFGSVARYLRDCGHAVVAAFLSTFWSIFGVNLFSDAYMQRCRVLSHPTDDGAWPHDMLQPGPCSASPLSGYQCRAANAEILAHYIAKLCDEDPMPMWEYCWLLSFPSIRNSIAIKK